MEKSKNKKILKYSSSMLLSIKDKIRIATIYEGLPIIKLTPNSSLENAGLLPGDILTYINDIRIKNDKDFYEIKITPSEIKNVSFIRDGIEYTVEIEEI
jgi:S1-C subfamily serine protease